MFILRKAVFQNLNKCLQVHNPHGNLENFQSHTTGFNDIAAYPDFFQKFITVIRKIISYKIRWSRWNWSYLVEIFCKNWTLNYLKGFELFIFKRSRHHTYKELFNKAKYKSLKLIARKTGISETIGKSKKLRESFKYLGIPKETLTSNFSVMEENERQHPTNLESH